MSSSVFPTFTGLGWSIKRTAMWQARIQSNVSGKTVRISDWAYPKYQWELTFTGGLRQGSGVFVPTDSYTDMANLLGFYNARLGQVDSFLYRDQDDNSVTTQGLGVGDGTTTSFQLVRSFGGYAEPVFSPNVVSNVYLNGVVQAAPSYTVYNWSYNAAPGTILFTSAPANGVVVTADFTYYWPCYFVEGSLEFEKILAYRYIVKSLKFISTKGS
jgi:uncharacterized protein (TIGR02217 family)